MGLNIPPEPTWQPCPDCLDDLPETFNGQIISNLSPAGTYSGILYGEGGAYYGTLYRDEVVYVTMYVHFCQFADYTLTLNCAGQSWCTGRVIYLPYWFCWPFGSGVSDDGEVSFSFG